jgi:hypothetical protein
VTSTSDRASDALLSLFRLVAEFELLDDVGMARGLVEAGQGLVPSAERCSVVELAHDHSTNLVLGDAAIQAFEAVQLTVGRGPLLATNGLGVRSWRFPTPHFGQALAAAAEGLDIKAVLTVGLPSSGASPLADDRWVLSLYSDSPFGSDDLSNTSSFANAAVTVIDACRRLRAAERRCQQLLDAVDSHDLVGQAKGALAWEFGITADQAFDELRRRSQVSNVKLREVALHVVEQLGPARGDGQTSRPDPGARRSLRRIAFDEPAAGTA